VVVGNASGHLAGFSALVRRANAVLAERRAAFRARIHGGTATAGARLFHLGQIESAGRGVNACHRHIKRTAVVLDGTDGHCDD
jgi:hypothetical protein